MKIFLLLYIITSLYACTSTIYIVRHAEKSTEPKADPKLTDQGQKRAIDLKNILSSKKIKKIFSTNTNRTKETATQISDYTNIPIELYNNDSYFNFYKNIFISKKNTLVIGHSNTILKMLDTLKLYGHIKSIGDNDYDNLFIIKVKKYCTKCTNPFKGKLIEKKYGNITQINFKSNSIK